MKFQCSQHNMKGFRIPSFSGPYSVQMQENMDQKKSEYGHFYTQCNKAH